MPRLQTPEGRDSPPDRGFEQDGVVDRVLGLTTYPCRKADCALQRMGEIVDHAPKDDAIAGAP